MLARIDGKSPVEYLDEPARVQVRTVSRDMIATRLDDFRELSELVRKNIVVRK
jgi:hypothetical protein